jgi:hypothetical protein
MLPPMNVIIRLLSLPYRAHCLPLNKGDLVPDLLANAAIYDVLGRVFRAGVRLRV